MQATRGSRRGRELFFVTLVAVAALRIALQSLSTVPVEILPIANALMAALFLGGPLLALCFAATDKWNPQTAGKFFIIGVVTQAGCFAINKFLLSNSGIAPQIFNAIGQIGLPIWCVGLGALLATLIKDKNIVVPIAIFLAFLDMFLVFSPLGVTNRLIRRMPDVLPAIAVQVPHASHAASTHHITPGSLAGPADFLFLAMFLIALFRFNMRAKTTVLVVIPTLIIYMFLVTLLKSALPALVPIGLVVLIINWKEFKLTKDEKISTAFVTVLGLSLFVWGMFQKPQLLISEPSPKVDARQAPIPPMSPQTKDSD